MRVTSHHREGGKSIPIRSQFETGYLKTDLKGRSVRGGAATIIGQVGRFFIQTGSTMVLARLLVPADFGLIAMVTAVTGFAALFKDLGLSMATIQRAEINQEQISTLFWVNVAASVLIAFTTIALSPAIAWFYGEPRLSMITVALSLVFVFGGITVQHQALLQRQMRFRGLALIQIVSLLIGAGVGVITGLMGAQYWALVMMQITSALAIAVGVWVLCDWRPGWPARNADVRSMLAFGANLTGFSILNYFSRNLDNVLIGKVWGPASLGLYAKAYALLMLPISQITAPIASVAISALCRLQSDSDEYARYYYRAINIIALVTMPMIMILAGFAQEIILIVLGNQWINASPIFKVLAFAALLQPVTNPTGWVYVSLGQTNRMLRWAFFAVPITVLFFFIGLPWGPFGVAVAYTIACLTVLTFPGLWWAFRESPLSIRGWMGAVQCPFVASLGMYVIIEIIRKYFIEKVSYWETVGFCGIAISIWIIVLILAWEKARTEVREAWLLLRHLRRDRDL